MLCLRRRTQIANPMINALGETAEQSVKKLEKVFDVLKDRNERFPLTEISKQIDVIWDSVFSVAQATAPQKKYELAEEFLNHPGVVKNLLMVFDGVQVETKRKIRDLLIFIRTWTSNDFLADADGTLVPNPRLGRPSQQFQDVLYECRFIMLHIVHEGYAGSDSIGLYNDIIRIFAEDDACLMFMLKDKGTDSNEVKQKFEGCVWAIFDRLVNINNIYRGFHILAEIFETFEIIFSQNHEASQYFFYNNLSRFSESFHCLIASKNFFIQTKSLRFVRDIFSNRYMAEVRRQWMADSSLIKYVFLHLQSIHKTVRLEAVGLLNIFVQNPCNSPPIHKLISINRKLLLEYCRQNAPNPKDENQALDELFDETITYLMNWNDEEPAHEPTAQDTLKMRSIKLKMRREHTIELVKNEIPFFPRNNLLPTSPRQSSFVYNRRLPRVSSSRAGIRFGETRQVKESPRSRSQSPRPPAGPEPSPRTTSYQNVRLPADSSR
ncbi:hypothetical protein B9Z55_002976 [Caenorhabditis nigoni]|uniref:Uncharacterized protein n=1 Tax=Caenorhabditis nigoni TaxID=1611254 RepID=A0A2G5VND8_9PELO|nr:hypothetical protein B9Z55_002976 [Caenorhabditis nigoni]